MFEGDLNIIKIAFNTSKEGIFIVNCESKIVFANLSLHQFFNYQSNELIGLDLQTLLPFSIHKKQNHKFHKYIQDSSILGAEHLRVVNGIDKNGKEIPVELRLSSFMHFDKRYVKAIITDISKFRELEKELKKSNVQLKEKVKDHSEELKKLLSKLQNTNTELKKEIDLNNKTKQKLDQALSKERELNQMKSLFLSMASHEFRTPLSGIQTSVDLINKYIEEDNVPAQKQLISIKRMVRQLTKILDDFLSIDKIDNNEVEYVYTEFNIEQIIFEILTECASLVKNDQKVHFTPRQNPEHVVQDKRILKVVVKNLLFNAVKYSPEGANIYIKVRSGKNIYIQVKDEGIGIPTKEQSKIGERFYRASNTVDFKGTGLGLHIIKHNLKALGGHLSFESEENIGTTFKMTLPNKKYNE